MVPVAVFTEASVGAGTGGSSGVMRSISRAMAPSLTTYQTLTVRPRATERSSRSR